MTTFSNLNSPLFWKTLAAAAGLVSIAVGAVALAGWALDVAALKSIYPSWVAIKANTAAGFILAGMALWLKSRERIQVKPLLSHAGDALAIVVAFLGAFTLIEYTVGISPGIDQLLFEEPAGAIHTLAPGRMAPASALCFLFLGVALMFDGKSDRSSWLVTILAVMATFPALASGLAYLYGLDNLYGLGYGTQMAAHTVLAFLVLALGVLCSQPERGLIALVASPDTGGTIARRLLPLAIVLPIMIGWLKLAGDRARLFEPDFGVVLVVLSYILVLNLLIAWSARILSRADVERNRANEVIRANEERLHTLTRTIPDIVWLKNPEGIYLFCNSAFERFCGAKEADIVGKSDYDFVDAEQADFFRGNDLLVMNAGETKINEEWITFADDGHSALMETIKTPMFDGEGRLLGVLGIARDITLRHRTEAAIRNAHQESARLLAEADQSRQVLLGVLEDQKLAEAKIRDLNASLEQRVRERTAELEAANKELESFSYSVSHDLRAPLRAINGFSQILIRRHRDGLNEEGRHYLDNVVTASERMGVLIEELLHYSRTARSSAQAVPVPLAPIVKQLKATFSERIAAANADFMVMEPLAIPLGDSTLIGQILANLVDNALTYCTRDGAPRVTLSSVCEDGKVVLRVADNGIGIAPEYHEKVFQVFQRLHSEAEYPGTGIGLAIVAKAARMMEGEIGIESALGAGSTFSVRLPAASEERSEA
ncbi:MAG: PAS domain S-box protein [Betaproteobacteria bacterium]|nr:PAS domain S-box protein [Betaproteobacteria bacterium]